MFTLLEVYVTDWVDACLAICKAFGLMSSTKKQNKKPQIQEKKKKEMSFLLHKIEI